MEYITLNNGISMPMLGLGVWNAHGDEAYNEVRMGVDEGYRLIDTAAYYENEAEVGRAVRDCGVPRGELFITSKVWPSEMVHGRTLASFERSLDLLGLDYLDLFLLHWPIGDVAESWRTLEGLYREGRVCAVGVSNFMPAHIDELLKTAEVVPALNQIESYPHHAQEGAAGYSQRHGIAVEAWGPLGKGKALGDPVIAGLAGKYEKTPAQIVLRWHLQRNVITIPKSVRRERLRENFDIFGFELSESDMAAIAALDRGAGERYYPTEFDPDRFGVIPDSGMAAR